MSGPKRSPTPSLPFEQKVSPLPTTANYEHNSSRTCQGQHYRTPLHRTYGAQNAERRTLRFSQERARTSWKPPLLTYLWSATELIRKVQTLKVCWAWLLLLWGLPRRSTLSSRAN